MDCLGWGSQSGAAAEGVKMGKLSQMDCDMVGGGDLPTNLAAVVRVKLFGSLVYERSHFSILGLDGVLRLA